MLPPTSSTLLAASQIKVVFEGFKQIHKVGNKIITIHDQDVHLDPLTSATYNEL